MSRTGLSYRDPLDEIWLSTARRIGFSVERTGDAYALTRGDGVIRIGAPELLDADDGLAQMILHELCHALVEGEDAWRLPDWGLDNMTARDEPREHACLRVQAALLRPHGLRRVLAPTTDYRSHYDELPEDPLAGAPPIVRIALGRAGKAPFAPHLKEALAATEAVARAASRFGGEGSLWQRVEPAPPAHPLGCFLLGDSASLRPPLGEASRGPLLGDSASLRPPLGEASRGPLGSSGRCGDCVWRHEVRGVGRCRHAADARVAEDWPGCERWEPELDCQDCGACCREAYHSVTVPRRDPVVALHPELVVRRNGYVEIRREGGRCAALAVDGSRYACTIYSERPRPCREFERGGANCLEARRRVGLAVV